MAEYLLSLYKKSDSLDKAKMLNHKAEAYCTPMRMKSFFEGSMLAGASAPSTGLHLGLDWHMSAVSPGSLLLVWLKLCP